MQPSYSSPIILLVRLKENIGSDHDVLAAWSVVGRVYVYLGQSGPAKAKAVLSFLSRDGAVW